MKLPKRMNITTLIALFLMISFAFPYIILPTANAATVNYTSYVYVGTSAGAAGVGVGQNMLLVAWTADMPPDTGEISGVVTSPTGRAGWYGMQVKVTDPDNITTTLDMPYSDPVGANYITYTPTKAGTYNVQAIFPRTDKEIKVTLASGGSFYTAGDHYIYTAAVSPTLNFNVTAEPKATWNESPLPDGYWTRPLSGANRQMYYLTGNWLGGAANVWPLGSSGGNIANYAWGSAPESAHILWSKPFFVGGTTDERFNDSMGHTAHYQGVEFTPTIVLDGKIHWTPRYVTHGSKGYQIIDLYTGKTLLLDWNATCPAMGQIYEYESPNQHGTFSYLWDTGLTTSFFGSTGKPIQLPQVVTVGRVIQTQNLSVIKVGNPYKLNTATTPLVTNTIWKMMDAYTGNTICYIANVSTSGTQVTGKDGSILYYNIVNKGTTSNPSYYCTVWNTSAGDMVASQSGTGYWQWRPAGGDFGAENPYYGTGDFFNPMSMDYDIVHNGDIFYSQNFSIPNIVGPTNALLNETGTVRAIRQDDQMIIGTAGRNDKRGVVQGWMMGISLKPENKGTQLWKTTFTPPFVDIDKNITAAAMFTGGFSLTGVYPEDGIMVFGEVKQLKTWVYDLYTGQQLWTTDDAFAAQNQYDYYGMNQVVIDHKVIVYGGYAGSMTAFDAKTGQKLWTYDALNIGDESPYGNYPMQIGAVCDGKIYTVSWEHSYTIPIIRGPNLRCINVTDGTEIWSTLDWGVGLAIADGILIHSNSMDNMIYAHGKGLSATTVSAPQTYPTLGSSVMITGTVTDNTPTGRLNSNDQLDFTLKGTPAISDKDMSRWMEYLFEQQVYPADAKGVNVKLETIDPNGNHIPIGTVTSDVNGNYGIPFTPEVPGTYQIIARFEGSASYGSSSATTYMGITNAAPTTAPTAAPQPNLVTTSDLMTYMAIGVIAIIITIVIVGLFIIRKRP
jgi:hypothetical protein